MSRSTELFQQAKTVIPGGVNSPVRAFNGVGGEPVFFKSGQGPYLIDVDDKQYIDYVGSWGPMILGHNHPEVYQAVVNAASNGLSFGAPIEAEYLLAKKVTELMPNIEKVRMVNSGTEATMTAIRLARGVTGRNKILKFIGCYHGHSDGLLVDAGSGVLTLGLPSCPGIPKDFTQHTLSVPFNDLEAVNKVIQEYGHDLAAIIVEPVAGNMGCVLPNDGFLQGLRNACDEVGALLIFDEVMTGFRIALGGAYQAFGVKADITTLGKVIGGGMPVGAIGGTAQIMDNLAPVGNVYQAGTLSGNPVAMAAGIATLELLSKPGVFERLSSMTQQLIAGLEKAAAEAKIAYRAVAIGGMFGGFFSEKLPTTFDEVKACNNQRFKTFFHQMLAAGVYLAPSAFEAGFVSTAHEDGVIALTIEKAKQAFMN